MDGVPASAASGRRAAHVRDTRQALLGHGPPALRRRRLPGHPHRGDRPAGRADPGRALPPLPGQGGPLPGGATRRWPPRWRPLLWRRSERPAARAPGTLFRANSEVYLDAASTNPAYRQIVLIDGPAVLGWRTCPSGATAPPHKIAELPARRRRRGRPRPQPIDPLAHLLSALGTGSAMYVAHADDPEEARREISECNERFLAGLGVPDASARAAVPTETGSAPPTTAAGRPRPSPCGGEPHRQKGRPMAWDFSTEPEFQAKLDWARQFVARQGRAARHPLPAPAVPPARRRAAAHRRPDEAGGARPGPVGRPPRARARRQGLRPGQAGPAQRDPRACRAGPPSSSAPRPPTRATPRSSPTTGPTSRRSSTSSRSSTVRSSPATR